MINGKIAMEKDKRKSVLVVTRNVGQAVEITTPSGDVIEVALIQIRGRQARIGFKCTRDFNIVRTDRMSSKDDQ
jgi:sRNA-binding carbon storage regulator CsrA